MERNPDQIFDELLVMKCQEKDEQAYALLWKRWQPKILKWSFGFINDTDVSKEVAQESWVSIHNGIGKLRDPAMFRFWVYKIVKRRAADWVRKEQQKRSGLEEIKHQTEQQNTDEKEEGDPIDQILKMIKELPDEHQEILRLFYLDKTPVKFISAALKLPVGTIKSRLYYARELLKKKLKERNHE